jgi:hypothetical protein
LENLLVAADVRRLESLRQSPEGCKPSRITRRFLEAIALLSLINDSTFNTEAAFIQQNFAALETPQSGVVVAYPEAQTSGNANIIAIGWQDGTANIVAVADSAGNQYREGIATFRGNGLSQAIYYAAGIRAGSNAVTVTFDQPASFADVRITEYSELAQTESFDAGSSASGTGVIANGTPVVTSVAGELLFVAGMTSTTFTGPGVGFTTRILTEPGGNLIQDKWAGFPAAYGAKATLESGPWLIQVAAFKPGPSGTRPSLQVSRIAPDQAVITWPAPSTDFKLQDAFDLNAPQWSDAPEPVVVVGDENQVTISITPENRYFRLFRP